MNDLKRFYPIAEAITHLLYPHAEAVIHNLKTGKIAAIYHNLSKRKVGDESLIEEIEGYKSLPDVFPVYLKTNWDGRKIKCVTTTLRDSNRHPIGLLCINLDISKWEELHHLLEQWLHHQSGQKQPEVLFKDDWRERINLFVTNFLQNENTTLKLLGKEKKQELVNALHREGAFKAKNAASYVAEVLDVSRATIYNYLRITNEAP